MDERLAYAQVLRLCRTLLRDQDDAEDAAQEVFARAAAAGRDGSSLPWLLGVTRHVCLDEYRRRSRDGRALAKAAALSPEDAADPEQAALGHVLLAQLLPHLSPAEGRLLRHRVMTGASQAEAAGDLGVAGTTVRMLAMRLRQKLRPHLPELALTPTVLSWLRRFRGRGLAFVDAERAVATAAVAAVVAIILGATPTQPDTLAAPPAPPTTQTAVLTVRALVPPPPSVAPPTVNRQVPGGAVTVGRPASGPGRTGNPPPVPIPVPPPRTCPPTASCVERTPIPLLGYPDVITGIESQIFGV